MIGHFLLNFNLVKLKRPTLPYSTLLILITFVEIFSTIMNKYQDIISKNYNISSDSYQAKVISIFQFLDAHTLIQQSQLILQILYWWFSTQSALIYTLYGICYYQVRFLKKKNIIENFNAKLLAQLLIIDQWITCQPTQLLYLNIFNCPSNQTCLQIAVSESAQQIVAGVFLFFRFCFQIIIIIFFTNHYSVKKDLLASGSKFILIYFESFRLILNIFITIPDESQMFHIVFLSYLLITIYTGCILFSISDFKLCFSNPSTRKIFKICFFILFGLILGLITNSLALFLELTNEDNSLFISLIFIILSVNIFYQFYVNQQIRQLCSNELNGDLLMQKIINLKQISKQRNMNHEYGQADSFYLGMIFSHFQKDCPKEKSQRCFCLMRTLFDPKKLKDIRNNQFSMLRQKNLYLKFLTKAWYENYLHHHPYDNELRINYAVFLNYQMNNPIQAQLQIQILRKCKLNILQQYDLSKIEMQLKNESMDRNSQSYKNELDFEFVINTEEIIKMIETHIQNFLDFSLKFWRRVLQKIIFEEDLWNLNSDINITIKSCDQLWNQVLKNKVLIRDQEIQKNYLIKRPKWQFLYNWYHLFVLNKKIKQSMLEFCDSANIMQKPVDEDSGSDNQNLIDQFSHLKPFNYTSAIFHTLQSGQIITVSESAYDIFGFKQFESINQLLPQIIIRNHQHGIEQFVQTGKTKIMYKRRKVLALNSEKHIMPCKKYLKWYISPLSQIEYVCMIRPIYRHQSVSYILVNKDWEIDSVSESIQEYFQIGLCLFMLCPKLLKYSIYSQYLGDEDLRLFKLKRTKNEDNNQDSIVDAKFTNKKITVIPTKYKPEYMKQSTTSDQISMVLEEDPKEADSPLWINDALNEEQQPEEKEKELGVRRFHKVVDEDHIKLTFRLPKKLQNLIEDYELTKSEIHKNGLDQVTQKSRLNEQRIVKRNQAGKLIIDKKILFQRLFEFQEFHYDTMYNHFKSSFQQYCMTSRMLKTVIKVEASIRFTKQAIMDQYQIIKITNFNVIESQMLDRKSKGVKVLNRQNQTTRQRLSVFQHHQSNALQQLIEQNYNQQVEQNYQKLLLFNFYNNSEVDSYRNSQNKALLSEDQVVLDFNNQKISSLTLTTESNIFIKEENNKPIKQDIQLNFFRILNRIFLAFLIVENIIIAFQGPNMTLTDLDDLGFKNALRQYNFLNIMIESYDKTLTIFYYQNNLLNVDNTTELFLNLQQSFVSQKNDVQLLLKQESFVKNVFKSKNYGDKNILDLISQYSSNLGNLQAVRIDSDIQSEIEFFRDTFVPFLFNHQSNNIYFTIQRVIDGFQNQNQICKTIIIFSSGIFGFYLLYNILNIIKSIQQCQKVSKQLSYIEKNEIEDCLRFYASLRVQFSCICNLNGLIQNNYFTSTNKTVIREIDDIEKNNNLKRQKQKQFHWSKKWKRIKILMIIRYLIFISLITFLSYFYFIYMSNFSLTMIDLLTQNGFLSQTTQLMSLTVSKEIFIYDFYNNSFINFDCYKNLQIQYIKNNSEIISSMYSTNIDEIEELFDGDLCLLLNSQINLSNCQLFLNGALTYGLKQYNYLLSQMAQQLLNPNEGLYENTTVQKLFEFDEGNRFQEIGYRQAWNKLQQKFSDNFAQAAKLEIIFLSCTFSFTMIIFIVLFEIMFFNQMSSIIVEMRNFYKRYFSNTIVDQYKLVRAQLIQCKVINK